MSRPATCRTNFRHCIPSGTFHLHEGVREAQYKIKGRHIHSSTRPAVTMDGDVFDVSLIDSMPAILDVACQITGMRFAAVARVTKTRWTVCAVRDGIEFGLVPGGELDLHSTICNQSRTSRTGVVISHVDQDAVFRDHPMPR